MGWRSNPDTSHKHIKISLSVVTSSVEWGSQRHLPLLIVYGPMTLSGHLVEKDLPPVGLHRSRMRRTADPRSSAASLLTWPLEYLLTCSSNWKFFSKTRSMWSRKAECSCCCRLPRLPFGMKRKICQVVESLPKRAWWWDTTPKQNSSLCLFVSRWVTEKIAPPVPFSKILQYPWDNFKLIETENQSTIKILNTDFLPRPGNSIWLWVKCGYYHLSAIPI